MASLSNKHSVRTTKYRLSYRRLNFCQWFNQQQQNARFLANFVIGDDAAFCINGEVNSHNVRQYAPKGDPPDSHYVRREERGKVTVWMGICGNGSILGPFFFNRTLMGMLIWICWMRTSSRTWLIFLIINFKMAVSCDFGGHKTVLQLTNLSLYEIGFWKSSKGVWSLCIYHAFEWPPRSPDLTPCDYFLWGYLKDKVYRTPPQDINDLRNKIQDEAELLRGNPALIRRVLREMQHRSNLCVVRDGGHTEKL